MEKRLYEMDYKDEGVVKEIDESVKLKVAGMGIRVGKRIKMMTRQPMKGPVVVVVDGADISVGIGVADKIVVDVEK